MKNLIVFLFCAFALSASCSSCKKDSGDAGGQNSINTSDLTPTGSKMKITIGTQSFTATLYDNLTVTAFKAMLPLTLNMDELNGNEKKYDLPDNLPTNAANPGTIHNGDLMLYGSSTIVLFYKGFNTSYPYTRIGRIDNPSGLEAALGTGNIQVSYQLE